jgi:hypothetical protein
MGLGWWFTHELVEKEVDVLGKGETLLKEDLNNWLKSRKEASAERLLLTRYERQIYLGAN